MEDRIKINGVWYVKEDTTKPSTKELEFDFEIVEVRELIIETNEFIMKGSVLEDNNDGVINLSMPSIDTKFKNDDRDIEYWDNDAFIIGIAVGEPQYLEMMDGESEKVKEAAITIAKRMLELDWI